MHRMHVSILYGGGRHLEREDIERTDAFEFPSFHDLQHIQHSILVFFPYDNFDS